MNECKYSNTLSQKNVSTKNNFQKKAKKYYRKSWLKKKQQKIFFNALLRQGRDEKKTWGQWQDFIIPFISSRALPLILVLVSLKIL